jgi:hypothetical protein
VEQRRERTVGREQLEGLAQRWGPDDEHVDVQRAQHRTRLALEVEVADGPAAAEHRQVVQREPEAFGRQLAALHLGVAAQVEGGAHPSLAEEGDLVVGDAVERVGPVEGSPAHRPTVGGRVATEVADVERGLESDHPVGVVRVLLGVRDGHRARRYCAGLGRRGWRGRSRRSMPRRGRARRIGAAGGSSDIGSALRESGASLVPTTVVLAPGRAVTCARRGDGLPANLGLALAPGRGGNPVGRRSVGPVSDPSGDRRRLRGRAAGRRPRPARCRRRSTPRRPRRR